MADARSAFSPEDEKRIEDNLALRERVIKTLTEKGIPEDSSDRRFLSSMMDGMDKLVIQRTRIKVDDSANKSQQETAALIGQLLTKITVNAPKPVVEDRPIPTLDSSITVTDSVPGETAIGTQQLTYDTFVKTMSGASE